MNNNGTRVKVFYVKNRQINKNSLPFSHDSSNSTQSHYLDLSTFQKQYLSKNRSRSKDIIHLSTLLQRDKVDDFQETIKKDEIKYHASKSLSIQPTYNRNDQFFNKFSNQKLKQNLFTSLSQSHHHIISVKGGVNIFPFTEPIYQKLNQSEEKFFTLTLQRKFIKPNNLSSMFKQKWCEHKLKKGQQKISDVFKTTLNFNNHISSQSLDAKLKPKQTNKFNKNLDKIKSKQKKLKINEDFLSFLQQKKFSLSQPKIKKTKDIIESQKIIAQRKIIYEPSEKDFQKSENRKNSLTEIKSYKKSKILPCKVKSFFNSASKKLQSQGQIPNQKIYKNKKKIYSNKMIDKKRKSFFLPQEDHDKLWWSKEQVVEKSGYNFDLAKAVIF